MTKFLYAISTDDYIGIESVIAPSYEDAKEKIINAFFNDYEELTSTDWDTFLKELGAIYNIYISDPVDIETL